MTTFTLDFQFEQSPEKYLLFLMACRRVRKSTNFPDSKIFHAKTFRIKRVNRNTFAFATKVRKKNFKCA